MDNEIKVVIIEDEKEVREGLKYLIELDPNMAVINVYDRAEDCIKDLTEKDLPNVILMDIGLPGQNGIEATHSIKKQFPEINILILTIFEEEHKIMN
ncbi:MAG: response regulator transcription factor, partial [Spirochaetes bacterium]|nr:response regulator transcription factor [Spirochaetota bacterium]